MNKIKTSKELKETIQHIATKISDTIAQTAIKAYESMTPIEASHFNPETDQGNTIAYTARALILSLDINQIIDTYNAQSITEKLPKLKRTTRKALSTARQSSK